MSAEAHQNRPANFFKRIAAMVYDGLILLAIAFVYGWAVLIIKYKFLDIPLPENGRAELGVTPSLGLIVVLVGFYCFFWRFAGQTLGMRAWRLRVINQNGQSPNWTECLLRCVTALMSLAIFGLGYFWSLIDKNNMTLHDHLSKTQVVQYPKA